MTNLIETAKAAAKRNLGQVLATLAGGFHPGEAHLTGQAGGARASTLDQDLDALLHEIQRRRAHA